MENGSELSRRERRKLEIRDRILEAGVALFDERGLEATRVAEICERADVANKTFFNYFPTKQALLEEIAHRGLEQLLVDIEDARKRPGSTRERIHHYFEHLACNAEEVGPMHRELLTEIIQIASRQTSLEPQQARRVRDAFGAIVEDGLALGDLSRAHEPETLTEMLMGGFYVLMFNWANLERYPLRERALAMARFLGDAIADTTEGRG